MPWSPSQAGGGPAPASEPSPKGLAETGSLTGPAVHRGSLGQGTAVRGTEGRLPRKGGNPGAKITFPEYPWPEKDHCLRAPSGNWGREGCRNDGEPDDQVPLWVSAALANSGSQAEGRGAGRGTWGADD